MSDFLLKKSDLSNDILFDLELDGNDIKKDNSILTATLISIFTDGSQPYFGTQLNNVVLGNQYYHINKLSEENIRNYRQGIAKSLQWLIDDGIVSSNTVIVEKYGNRLNVKITQVLNDGNSNNLIYSLDENMEIIDDIAGN